MTSKNMAMEKQEDVETSDDDVVTMRHMNFFLME